MAPAEVLCQNRHLSLLRPGLDESNHMEEVLAAEAGAILSRQLSRQRRDNLITVFRPRIAEDIAPYPSPNLPVEHHEFRVDGSRHPEPRDRKSTRLNSSHTVISYAVFCLK